MGAVGVEAGLEPDPGVADLGVREGAGDLGLHGVAAGLRNLELGGALADRIADGLAAEIGDARALADQRDLLGRLDHAGRHDPGCQIDRARVAQELGQLRALRQGQVVALDADRPGAAR